MGTCPQSCESCQTTEQSRAEPSAPAEAGSEPPREDEANPGLAVQDHPFSLTPHRGKAQTVQALQDESIRQRLVDAVQLPTPLVFSTNLSPVVQKRRMALSKQALHPSLWKEEFFPPNRSVSHPSWGGEMFCFFSAVGFFFPSSWSGADF